LFVDTYARQFLDPAVDFGIENGLAVHHRADLVGGWGQWAGMGGQWDRNMHRSTSGLRT
jgi:hypothetical protein